MDALFYFGLAGVVSGSIYFGKNDNNNNNKSAGLAIVFTVASVITMAFGIDAIAKEKYKQGQIDAVTGNMKYELVVQPDSTTTWEMKK